MKTFRSKTPLARRLGALAALCLQAVVIQGAALDVFLEIDGIEGESQDARHRGEIEVDSWAWAMIHPPGSSELFNGLTLNKRLDKSSPGLMRGCATGERFARAVLTLRRGAEPEVEFYRIILEDVLVSSYLSSGGSESGVVPTESISLNFERIGVEYVLITGPGGIGGPGKPGEFAWDIQKNAPGGISFPPFDTDGDGMSDDWEAIYGLNFLENDALLDSDNDGATNLEEFRAGMSPRDANRVFKALMTFAPGDRNVTLSWPSADGRSYQILVSDSLDKPFTVFATVPASGPGSTTIEAPADLATQFFRIQLAPGQ